MKTFGQLWRVVVTNLVSAGIDYGVFFLLSASTGITSGNGIIPLNMISFTLATTNAYYLNKHWSFNDDSKFDHHRKFTLFLLVAVVALILNTLIVRFITTDVQVLKGFGDHQWLFAAKLAASVFSFTVNFLGYKFIVFKK